MDSGWLKLYRILLDKPIWRQSTPEQKVILITLLLMADHKPQQWSWKGQRFTTQPGQFITSLESIAHRAGKGISVQNVRGALKKFMGETYNFLTNESTKTGRLITIINWDSYQHKEEKLTNHPTVQPTKTQQRGNKEVTPNKKLRIKEIKNPIPFSLKKYPYPEWVNQELFLEWAAMRTKIKKPITSNGTITRALNKLKSLIADGYGQDLLIEKAIDSNWQSFYPPKNGNGQHEPSPPKGKYMTPEKLRRLHDDPT